MVLSISRTTSSRSARHLWLDAHGSSDRFRKRAFLRLRLASPSLYGVRLDMSFPVEVPCENVIPEVESASSAQEITS